MKTRANEKNSRTLFQRLGSVLSGIIGFLSGLAPHILHHVGFLAGALFAGAFGIALFGILGLVLSLPFLIRLYRRFGTLIAPGIALGIFTTAFLLSSLVIGPAINASLNASKTENQKQQPKEESPSHEQHQKQGKH